MPQLLDPFENPPIDGEDFNSYSSRIAAGVSTDDAQAQQSAQQDDAQTGYQRDQAATSAAFKSQGVANFTSSNGALQAVTAVPGGPPLQGDGSNGGLVYGQDGSPQRVTFPSTDTPKLVDAYSPEGGGTTQTDKAGNTYATSPGAPWKWTGTDPAVQAQNQADQADQQFKEQKQALDDASGVYGSQVSQAKARLAEHAAALKANSKSIQGIPELSDVNPDDPDNPPNLDQSFAATGDTYNSRSGFFGGGALTASAQQARDDLASRKGQAQTLLDQRHTLQQRQAYMQQLHDAAARRLENVTNQRAALVGSRLQGDGLNVPDTSGGNAPAVPGLGSTDAGSDDASAVPQDPASPTAVQAPVDDTSAEGPDASLPQSPTPNPTDSQGAASSLEQPPAGPSAGQPFSVDDQGNLAFQTGHIADGLLAAHQAGAVESDKLKDLLPKAVAADKAVADNQALQARVGEDEYAKAKAVAAGASRAGAFLVGAIPAGEFATAAASETGIFAPVIGAVAGLAGGYLSQRALGAAADEISKHNDTIRSFQDAAQAYPQYDAAGQLVGLAVPSAIGAAKLAKVIGIRGAAVAAGDLSAGEAVTQTAKEIGTQAAAGAAFEGAVRPAFDYVLNQGKQALGITPEQDATMPPTTKSVLESAILGVALGNLGTEFKGYDRTDIQGLFDKGRAAAAASPDGNVPDGTFTAAEAEALSAVRQKMNTAAARGEFPGSDFQIKVQQAVQGTAVRAQSHDATGQTGLTRLPDLPDTTAGASPSASNPPPSAPSTPPSSGRASLPAHVSDPLESPAAPLSGSEHPAPPASTLQQPNQPSSLPPPGDDHSNPPATSEISPNPRSPALSPTGVSPTQRTSPSPLLPGVALAGPQTSSASTASAATGQAQPPQDPRQTTPEAGDSFVSGGVRYHVTGADPNTVSIRPETAPADAPPLSIPRQFVEQQLAGGAAQLQKAPTPVPTNDAAANQTQEDQPGARSADATAPDDEEQPPSVVQPAAGTDTSRPAGLSESPGTGRPSTAADSAPQAPSSRPTAVAEAPTQQSVIPGLDGLPPEAKPLTVQTPKGTPDAAPTAAEESQPAGDRDTPQGATGSPDGGPRPGGSPASALAANTAAGAASQHARDQSGELNADDARRIVAQAVSTSAHAPTLQAHGVKIAETQTPDNTSGIAYDHGNRTLLVDPLKLAAAANTVRNNGGDPQGFIHSAVGEENYHALESLAGGKDLGQVRKEIYNSIPSNQMDVMKAAYGPVQTPANLKGVRAELFRRRVLAAEYMRMLAQRRAGEPLTESHWKDPSAINAVLDGPQSEAVEAQYARMQRMGAMPTQGAEVASPPVAGAAAEKQYAVGDRVLVSGRAGTISRIANGQALVKLRPTPTLAGKLAKSTLAELKTPEPRTFQLPMSPTGAHDIIDQIHEQGGMRGKLASEQAAAGKSLASGTAGDFDDLPNLKGVYRQAVFGGTMSPDQMASALHDDHGIGDGTVPTMYRLVDQAMNSRRSARTEMARQEATASQDARFARDTAKGKKQIAVDTLNVGDALTVGDQQLKVTAVDPDTSEVTLEDHSKYGVQKVQDGQALFAEKIKKAPSTNEFAPEPVDNIPTLRSGEDQGDLLSKQTEDLTLVGEKGVDHGARQAEKEKAGQESAEALAKQEREQQPLFAANPVGAFIKRDLKPALDAAGENLGDLMEELRNFFVPAAGADLTARDLMGEMRGVKQQHLEYLQGQGKKVTDPLVDQSTLFAKLDNALRQGFDRVPRAEQIDFVDRYKTGKLQRSPELQRVAETIRKIDTAGWKAADAQGIPLPWLDDHYRVMWKIIPGSDAARENVINQFKDLPKKEQADFVAKFPGAVALEHQRLAAMMHALKIDPTWTQPEGAPPDREGANGAFRRPVEGDKGMLKRHSLNDMSSGLLLGGEPHDYNPWRNFERSQASLMQLVAARRMWNDMGTLKRRVFVATGAKKPEGYDWIDDKIANVYFKTDQGMVNAGKWAVEEGLARLINAHLAPDLLRASTLGNGLLAMKNFTTALELALSPFHFIFVSMDAAASSFGLGLQKIYNRAFLHGDAGALKDGLRDMLTAPLGMRTSSKLGATARKAIGDPEWLKTPEAAAFLKQYPDAARMIQEMFAAGMKLADQDWELNSRRAFAEALNEGNFIGATLRVFPTINETLMEPLFKHYIPNIKVGAFLRDYANALKENESQLAAGQVTRLEIARRIVRFNEDRFGEMNYDSLYWNRTFKSAMQLFTRSVTWKLGSATALYRTVAGFGGGAGKPPPGGPTPNGGHVFGGGGRGDEMMAAFKERRAPVLHRNAAWFLGLCVTTAVLGATIQKLLSGKNPEGLTDLVYPRIDATDDKVRVGLPTYLKDVVHLGHSPTGFVTSSLAGWLGRIQEIWSNKDFYGVEIRHPDDSVFAQTGQVLKKEGGELLPFSITGYKRLKDQDVSALRRTLSLFGLNPAPGYVTHTAAETKASELLISHLPQGARTQAAFEHSQVKAQVRSSIRKGDISRARDLALSGKLTQREFAQLRSEAALTPLQAAVHHLSLEEAEKVLSVANPQERAQLRQLVAAKEVSERKRFASTTPALNSRQALAALRTIPK